MHSCVNQELSLQRESIDIYKENFRDFRGQSDSVKTDRLP